MVIANLNEQQQTLFIHFLIQGILQVAVSKLNFYEFKRELEPERK